MHKLESLALSCGSKISRPYIHKSYYPIVGDNFICVSQQSDTQSNLYDYFNDVIFHIKPYLDKNKISILEIGKSNQAPLYYTKDFRHLNSSQSNYLVSKSKAYLGNFNYLSHISAAFSIPTVCPSKNTFIEVERPYWSDDKCFILNAKLKEKPTFSDIEHPKTVNKVNPEIIACKILDSLGVKHTLNKVKTIFVGPEYQQTIVDLVPGNYLSNNLNIGGIINVRMDKNFDLKFLQSCVNLDSFNIITDQTIPIEILKPLFNNLSAITYFIDSRTSQDSIADMESSGKPLNLLTKDKKNISKIRLKFLDYKIKEFGSLDKNSLNNGDYENLKFLSKRNVVFEGKAYNSYSSILSGFNNQEVKYSNEFLEDLPFCRVYKEIT
jgi:hypothetical protein